MTYYLEILGPRPFENGVDDNDRTQWTMNFEAMAGAAVGQWAYDLQKILADATLSTITPAGSRDTWIGAEGAIPAGDGPYIRIVETGSVLSQEAHNSDADDIEMLSAQITVVAQSRAVGETRALAAWRAITGTRDATVTP